MLIKSNYMGEVPIQQSFAACPYLRDKGSRSNCKEARAAMWFKTFMSIFIANYTRELSSFGNSVLLSTFLHHLRDIKYPEHPYSLEELKVISEDAIEVDDKHNCVRVTFTPTVEHCSMTTVKLMRSLPMRYKVCALFSFFL
ncbi:hypothetical protein HYC85_023058 [Camellia sinensis]|uniref:MIP18 family-like domain-containing protein n=1 Tax=Camellia sinensis TaxID=4442 RepID=A0A7J7GDF8_CAMSI|nr:hypothetical protein HYC85_023058 [Camellia sinensis]